MLISVVIPTYNRKDLVLRALDSVYQQTYAAYEVILVDDGSTDGTMDAIKTHFPATNYIKVSHQGVSAARNVGIRKACGDWIAFLDSDDVWHGEKLARQLACLKQNPDACLIHCDEQWVRNGKHLNQKAYHEKSGGNLFARSLERCLISPSAVLIKTTLFERVGLFDETLPACEDYDLWLRICAEVDVHFVPEKLLTKYGGHADQLSRTVWGLDRFRIESLRKIIRGDALNDRQHKQARAMLVKKLKIFLAGAAKRGHHDDVKKYSDMLNELLTQD